MIKIKSFKNNLNEIYLDIKMYVGTFGIEKTLITINTYSKNESNNYKTIF